MSEVHQPVEMLPLLEMSAPVPPVIADERPMVAAAAEIAAGHGPVGLDAERASGYRYGQRAYLVQLRREGVGSFLFDPVGCPDLSPVGEAIGDAEWILHAATQDLPCLAEVGLRPLRLFDTELGGRLAGRPKVGLGAMVEHYLGYRLAKEHSAADWSTRPLPEPWLLYAALDVEVLRDLRDAVHADLSEQGKWEWARQEFESLLTFTGPSPRQDPWRRTSGIHRIGKRRTLAFVRELWWARDDLARRRDMSPGRVLPDAAILAMANDASADGRIGELPKVAKRQEKHWRAALQRAGELTDKELPPTSLPGGGPPPPRVWADKDPVAAKRLAASRDVLAAFAEDHQVPLENLLTPDTLRRVIWTPPQDESQAGVRLALATLGARPWQGDIAAPVIAAAFAAIPSTDR